MTKALPTQERALKKRRAMLDAAWHEFSEKGYEQTTAKTITKRADVATGTFYHYFDNKDDVLFELTKERFAKLHDSVEVPDLRTFNEEHDASIQDLFRSIVTFVYDFHASESSFHQVLEQRRPNDERLDALMIAAEAELMTRTEQFVRRYNCPDPQAVAFCLYAMTEGLVHRHVFHDANVDREKVISCGVALLSAYLEKLEPTT